MLMVIDKYSWECIDVRTEREHNHETILETLVDLYLLNRPPYYIQSNNGSEFAMLHEVRMLIEEWQIHFGTDRPHSSLGYRPPSMRATTPLVMRAAAARL